VIAMYCNMAQLPLRREHMSVACVERGKGFSKEKHKRKLNKETKRITCSFLAFWMTMES